MRSSAALILVACAAAAGCGGSRQLREPSAAVQREVAARFAHALVHGDDRSALALVLRRDDAGLAGLVKQAAAPWKQTPASLRLPGIRLGAARWSFRYAARIAKPDGSFARESGDLVVVVAAAGGGGAAVQFFAFRNRHVSFSTHHDAQLLPSKR